MEYTAAVPSPLGTLILTSDGQALTGLSIGSKSPCENASLPLLDSVRAWLSVYFEGRDPGPVPCPLSPSGTAFQRQIWRLLLEIPYGETLSYGDLAVRSGRSSKSAQAVGQAVGKNPIAILIPCHRVLGRNGSLTGYAWGTDRKKALLDLESGNDL